MNDNANFFKKAIITSSFIIIFLFVAWADSANSISVEKIKNSQNKSIMSLSSNVVDMNIIETTYCEIPKAFAFETDCYSSFSVLNKTVSKFFTTETNYKFSFPKGIKAIELQEEKPQFTDFNVCAVLGEKEDCLDYEIQKNVFVGTKWEKITDLNLSGNSKKDYRLKFNVPVGSKGKFDFGFNLDGKDYLIDPYYISLTKAEHLDSDKNFVSDIYGMVKDKDNIWSEDINVNEFARITFEQSLSNQNDITIFAKAENPATIEVYLMDSNNLITTFDTIQTEAWHKVYLNGLADGEKHSSFDLKILGSLVSFDYIVDPVNIDTNIWQIDTNHGTKWNVNETMPVFSYSTDGNLTIDFNIASDTNYGTHYADINYSTSKTQGTGTTIINNLLVDSNRCQTNLVGTWNNTASSDANLVGYWKFDKQEDDYNNIRAFDYSGNNNHGQYLLGADNNALGKWDNNAGFFDGVNDSVNIPDSNWAFNAITISVWVNPRNGKSPVPGTDYITTGSTAFSISMRYRWDQNSFQFLGGDGATTVTCGDTMVLQPDTWTHLAVTYDTTGCRFYENGVFAELDGVADIAVTAQGNMKLGSSWEGFLEEMKIYNRALTAAEISLDYNLGVRNHRKCSWDWNISGVADQNYYANILARDNSGNSDYNSSNNNFQVNPSGASTTCNCPVSGNWYITDGSYCELSTVCDLGANFLYLQSGRLTIKNGGRIISTANPKIIFFPNTLYLEQGAKIG